VTLVFRDEATVCNLDTINSRFRNVGADACSHVEDATRTGVRGGQAAGTGTAPESAGNI
jgi:hypothetical protein